MSSRDYDALIRAYLVGPPAPTTPAGQGIYAGPSLAVLVGPRVYAATEPPSGYRPAPGDEPAGLDIGPAVVIAVVFPAAQRTAGPVRRPLIVARSYAATEGEARAVSRALIAHLSDATLRHFRRIWPREGNTLDREPEPRLWPFVRDTFGAIVI